MALSDKFDSVIKIFLTKRATKPQKMGDKILFLFTAPSVRSFYEYESVQEQFKDYDLAAVNFTLAYSEEYMHRFKPKYFVLLDNIFFMESAREEIPDWMRDDCYRIFEALERIDWDCYVLTFPLGEMKISNPHIHFIYLSVFNRRYKAINKLLYPRNVVNCGSNNVLLGGLYFAITFGYKQIAMLGCPYRAIDYEKKPDGLHIYEHLHYYDDKPWNVFVSNEELAKMKTDYSMWLFKRQLASSYSLWDIVNYSRDMEARIVNYSAGSQITMLEQGELNVPENAEVQFVSPDMYRYR